MITIVSSSSCPYCEMAKQLITEMWFEYEEKHVSMWSPELMEIVQTTWLMTVPQIFAGEISRKNLLWWYDDIRKLHDNGKLEIIFNNA
jgi:glutaredoxin